MKITKLNLRIIGAFLILAAAFIVFYLSYERVFDVYELHLLDMRYTLRPAPKIDRNIVFIEISDDSIKKIGSWPFERKYHALMVKALSHAGVKQVIFDVFFSEKTPDDAEFAKAIKEAGNVYMPYVFSTAIGRPLDFPLSDEYEARLLDVFDNVAKGTGHINIIPDLDGKFRRIPPFIKYEDKLYPHISFRTACDYLGYSIESAEIEPGRYIKLGDDMVIPLDLHSNIIVNFPGKWCDTFKHYSYVDVLSSYICALRGEKGIVNLDELKDSICYIGITATAAPDAHPSPFESLYPGIGVHGSLFNSMIYKEFISRASKLTNIFILTLLLLVTYIFSIRSKKLLSLFYITGLIALFLGISILLFAIFGIWINIFYPVLVLIIFYLALTFRRYIVEIQKREVLEKELSIAKNIQLSFLPKAKPVIKGIDMAAKMSTARQVGGDLYDFVDMSGDKTGIMIGDVSGKGVPAALYMAKVVSEFKSYAREAKVSDALYKLNKRLLAESGSNLFVTIAYMVLDVEKMTLDFSLGGHLPILMLREGEKEPRLLDLKTGMPLGIMEGSFEDGRVEVREGDLFILYTDGVTEAMNKNGEMFEQERLIETAKRLRDKDAGQVVDLIHEEINKFEGKFRQHDDITVIAVRIKHGA